MIRSLGISIEKLMMLDALEGSRILAGSSGITKKVTKVNVMEVPDILDWVSEGELLITTAYSIRDDIHVLSDLIPKLKSKGVVGLGIKVGRYVQQLPRDVIALADSLGFPIIEVPFRVSHTDVISAILSEVIHEQMNMIMKIEDFNVELMNIMIHGGGLKEIAAKLHDHLGNTLAIYENMNDHYEFVGNTSWDGCIIDQLIHEHASLENLKGSIDPGGIYKTSYDRIGDTLIERITIPIVIEKVEYGCILIWLDNKALTPFDDMLIKSYVHVIALEFVKKLALYTMEGNYKLDFFDDLLSDNKERQHRAAEKSKIFRFHRELTHTVIVILIKELYTTGQFTYNRAVLTKEYISSISFILNRLKKSQNEPVVFVEKSDRILILFGSSPSKDVHTIKKEALSFCERILIEVRKKFDPGRLIIGLGRSCEDIGQLWKSYQQAKLIVENLSRTHQANIIHYDDLGLYRILSFDGLHSELVEFCSATIQPLIEYDKVNNAELVKTLKQYFQCNGNMKEMSKKMYMHYNTIIYRLQKIRDITGLNLEEYDHRLNLEIALKIMDMVQLS